MLLIITHCFLFVAVVTDKEFRRLDYKNLLMQMRHFLRNATHQHLTHGELSTEFFTKTDLTIERGEIVHVTLSVFLHTIKF
jgi:hypothetical protein